ncbi:MlaD family protein [Nocardia carnea]|uniref:MlaD family protein n=1 Tax=Nocardia carnea TaxID=37328 RepID=A0ABW7TWI3_9NOCA|nr:MCE family protein [Nocardia carnea]
MPSAFEADDRNLPDWKLLVRGIGFALVAAALVAAGIARSQGAFESTVPVTALMTDIGDGLPVKSDVKYRGVLVGIVTEVTPGAGGGPNWVGIELWPEQARGIPATVTARVVPSNVFAVPSIQLVDNGPAPALRADTEIPQDHSLATVQLQTSLTALSRIAAAAGRSPTDPTVGILATVQRATSGRGAEMVQAGAQLERIARALDEFAAPGQGPSTIDTLARALAGLQSSAPDLLQAVHHTVGPMRMVAQQQGHLSALLSGGLVTASSAGTALTNHAGTLTDITGKMAPVLDVLARGSQNFVQMTTSQARLSRKFGTEIWKPESQSAAAAVIVELTPHKQYIRADCPRYGHLAGPSCATGPAGSAPVIPGGFTPAAADSGGGAVGGQGERDKVTTVLGTAADDLSTLLLGPLVRGNEVTVVPDTAEGPR